VLTNALDPFPGRRHFQRAPSRRCSRNGRLPRQLARGRSADREQRSAAAPAVQHDLPRRQSHKTGCMAGSVGDAVRRAHHDIRCEGAVTDVNHTAVGYRVGEGQIAPAATSEIPFETLLKRSVQALSKRSGKVTRLKSRGHSAAQGARNRRDALILLRLGAGDEVEQFGRDLGLACLAGILPKLLQLFRHVLVG